MKAKRVALALSSLSLVLLAGCGSAPSADAPATEEAIVGGLETVAPEDTAALSGEDLVDVVEAAGEYTCDADGDQAWTCSSDADGAAAISIVAGGQVELSADGAVPADTVEALADALGVDASELADDAGLRWP
jgi:hypothetical protein